MREHAVEEPVDTQSNAAWIQTWCVGPLRRRTAEAFFREILKKGRMLERSNGTPEQILLALVRQRESVLNLPSSAYKPLKKGEP